MDLFKFQKDMIGHLWAVNFPQQPMPALLITPEPFPISPYICNNIEDEKEKVDWTREGF